MSVAVALVWALVLVGVSYAATPAEDVASLATAVDRALSAVERSDLAAARSEMARFNAGWAEVEDGVRGLSRSSYRGIEDAQGDANFALGASAPDPQAVRAGLQKLRAECGAFVLSFKGAAPRAVPTP